MSKSNEQWMKDSLDYAQQHFSSNMSIQRKTYSVTSGSHKHEIIMKEESKLPKKWYIKVTEENAEVLSNWRTAGGPVNNGFLSNRGDEYSGLWDYSLPQDYEEISFELFKIHILKHPPTIENYDYLIPLLKNII